MGSFTGLTQKEDSLVHYRGLRWLTAVLLSLPAVAWAGPPFLTDDPEPVDFKHGELYLATQIERTKDGSTAALPQIEANYGVLPDMMVHVIAPMSLDAPKGEPTEYGYGDTELGVKYRFIHETDSIPMVGVFPLIELPTGSTSSGLGNGCAQLFLPVWLQKSFDDGKWTTYGGGGYWFNNAEDAKNHWSFGWELQRKITEQLTLGGEIFHQTSDEENAPPRTGFNLGAIINLSEQHHILFSVGRDFVGDTHLMSYLAYQFTF